MEPIFELCKEIGFSYYSKLNMDSLEFLKEVRDMCSEDKCKNYNRTWSCPPAIGSIELFKEKAIKYKNGIIVQTVGNMSDEFDFESIKEIEKMHKSKFDTLVRQTKRLYPSCMPMSSGTCTKCKKCTYPNKPCRHPETLYPSMEACGLLVGNVRKKSGLDYYHGKNTICFFSCILF